MVDDQRSGFQSSGMFVAQVVRVEDDAGHVLFQDLEAINGLLRYYGGDLEDYRDVGCRAVFLSYSHRDEEPAVRLRDAISTKGLRLWFDREDRRTEVTLLRFGFGEPDDVIKKVLGRAIERAQGLVLLLSENSVASTWVRWEVELASKIRRDAHKFLSCVAVENGVLTQPPDWVRRVVDSGGVHDFTDWRDPSAFEKSMRTFLDEVFLVREV